MSQFSVPQFVEVEDKIIGPLTLKQFFTFLVGAFIIFLLYRFVGSFFLFLLMAVPVGAATLAFSFGQFNGRPLISVVFSMFGFFGEPRSYVFHRQVDAVQTIKRTEQATVPKASLSDEERLSRLHKLAYILGQDLKEEESLIKKKYLKVK